MSTNVYIYSPTKTRSYDGSNNPPTVVRDLWESDTILRQGKYLYDTYTYYDETGEHIGYVYRGPYYGTMGTFKNTGAGAGVSGADIATELAGKTIVSARIRFSRYSSSGNNPQNIRLNKCDLTDVPGAGANSPNGSYVSGSGYTLGSISLGETKYFPLPLTYAEWVRSGKTLVIAYGGSWYLRLYGIENSSYVPILEITTAVEQPTLSTPPLGTISPVADSPHTFSCGASSDSGGFFAPSQLFYDFQFSSNGGSTWSAVYSSAQGSPSKAIDIKALLGLQPLQYYYNANCKIRVQARTPVWNGQPYVSAWATSAAFIVNYKIVPSAPSSLVPSKTAPYEGEAITFTVGLPAQCNSHNAVGAVMDMNYAVELADSTALVNGNALVTSPNKVLNYTVGLLVSNLNDRVTSIKAKCKDAENQTGPYLADVPFTIRRFHPPIATATLSGRTAAEVTVNMLVSDTGYGGVQNSNQISKVQYKGVPGAVDWTDAILASEDWGGSPGAFTNSFTIGDLLPGLKYALKVRAVNSPPADTALSGRLSVEYAKDILEFLPRLAGFRRDGATGDEAPAGGYMQAGIIGDNPDAAVDRGCLAVQYDINAGRKIKQNGIEVLICEHGGDDTEGYYKYSDGRLECYKVMTIASAAVTAAWGSGYELATVDIAPGNFLYPFIVAPRQLVWYSGSDTGNSAWAFSRSDPTATAWGKAKLARFTSATVTNARVNFEAKGRWK